MWRPTNLCLYERVMSSNTLTLHNFWQIKHMMAFIEQEASEKAEEIDAKVYSDAYTQWCLIKDLLGQR